jgi:hypothetical protein
VPRRNGAPKPSRNKTRLRRQTRRGKVPTLEAREKTAAEGRKRRQQAYRDRKRQQDDPDLDLS